MHLIHIGFPKAASTWLQDVVFSQLTEVDFVRADPVFRGLLANLVRPAVPFAEHTFRQALEERHNSVEKPILLSEEVLIRCPLDFGLISGEATAKRLSQVLIGARVLIIVRRQQDFLPSLYAQYVHEGGIRTFKTWIEDRDPNAPFDTDFLDIAAVVGLYDSLFSVENVAVIPFELLKTDPTAFVNDLERFLGCKIPPGLIATKPSNRSTAPNLLPLLRLWNRVMVHGPLNPKPLQRFLPGRHLGVRLAHGLASTVLRKLRLAGRIVVPASFFKTSSPNYRHRTGLYKRESTPT